MAKSNRSPQRKAPDAKSTAPTVTKPAVQSVWNRVTGPAANSPRRNASKTGKIDALIKALRRPDGASIDAMMKASGWQAHSVRGAISAAIKNKRQLNVVSEKSGGVRLYHIVDNPVA